MGKYVIMQDMRRMPSYRNINARLVYMHVSMGCDISTYRYETSYRRLALDLDMTLETVRSALRVLIRDGLIATYTTTQWTAQGTTQRATQRTTHLCIVIMRQNGTPNGTPNNTPNNTPDNTPDNTGNNTAINNYNTLKEEMLSLTHAREHAEELAAMAAEVLRLTRQEAGQLLQEFLKRKEIEQKTWTDPGDLKAHFLSWCEKNLRTLPKKRKNSQADDHAARMEEYQATEERTKEQTDQEKDTHSWNMMMKCALECSQKKLPDKAKEFQKLADDICDRWGWGKMTIQEYGKIIEGRRKAE